MGQCRRGLPALWIAVILLAVVGCDTQFPGNSRVGNGLTASGVITAEEVVVSTQHGGRIADVHVTPGDHVQVGQSLVVLDAALVDAQIAVAEAQLAVAQAGLRQLQAGARPGAIAIAEAQLAQAKEAQQAALQGLADAQALRDNAQELNMQVATGEIQVEAAEYRLQSAQALKDAAQVARDAQGFMEDQIRNWPYPVPPPQLPEEMRSATYDWWQAWAGVNAATVSLQQARSMLAHWRSVQASPHELNAQVALAEAIVAQAAAGVAAAEAQVDAYKAGPTEEQLSVARGPVAQAQVALDALLAQREEVVVVAPIEGVVLSKTAHAGELAAPGGQLLALADLSEVKLAVFVAENRLGEVALNQNVRVEVDAFPGRTFGGRVVHIADHAEYTPRNVATKEERVNTVYAVEIVLPNADGLLKPGMSADAAFVQ